MSVDSGIQVGRTHLVESEHLPDHLSTIQKRYLHAVVDLKLVSLLRFWAGLGVLTRFCYIVRAQSVSMRVFSGQGFELVHKLPTIFPCRFAAPDIVDIARPKTT